MLRKDWEWEEAGGKVKDMGLGSHQVIWTDGEQTGWKSAGKEVVLSWKKKMEILQVALVLGFYPYFCYRFPMLF